MESPETIEDRQMRLAESSAPSEVQQQSSERSDLSCQETMRGFDDAPTGDTTQDVDKSNAVAEGDVVETPVPAESSAVAAGEEQPSMPHLLTGNDDAPGDAASYEDDDGPPPLMSQAAGENENPEVDEDGFGFGFTKQQRLSIRQLPRRNSVKQNTPGGETPIARVPWEIDVLDYEPQFCTSERQGKDADLDDLHTIQWNQVGTSMDQIDRTSCIGPYRLTLDSNTPMNPTGRHGFTGRGKLPRYGPNRMATALVTRWRRDLAADPPELEFAAIKLVGGDGEWMLPSELGDDVPIVLKHLLDAWGYGTEATAANEQPSLSERAKDLVASGFHLYGGYYEDSRNTDNAWVESMCTHYHDASGELVGPTPSASPISVNGSVYEVTWINCSFLNWVDGFDAQQKGLIGMALQSITLQAAEKKHAQSKPATASENDANSSVLNAAENAATVLAGQPSDGYERPSEIAQKLAQPRVESKEDSQDAGTDLKADAAAENDADNAAENAATVLAGQPSDGYERPSEIAQKLAQPRVEPKEDSQDAGTDLEADAAAASPHQEAPVPRATEERDVISKPVQNGQMMGSLPAPAGVDAAQQINPQINPATSRHQPRRGLASTRAQAATPKVPPQHGRPPQRQKQNQQQVQRQRTVGQPQQPGGWPAAFNSSMASMSAALAQQQLLTWQQQYAAYTGGRFDPMGGFYDAQGKLYRVWFVTFPAPASVCDT